MPMIKMKFDEFVQLRNDLKLKMFYTETDTKIDIFFFMEAQVFYAEMTVKEIQQRFGNSQYVIDLFKSTYLRGAIQIESLDTGTTQIVKNIEIDTTNLKETLTNFLTELSTKLTTTTSGGQGTAGYAMIPVRMSNGKPKRCMGCGNIILSNETVCPSCGSNNLADKNVEVSLQKWIGWDFEGTVKYMIEFLNSYNFEQITTLNNKEKKSIRQLLIDSLTQGWTLNKLENEIEVIVEDENSARMIARSETIRAANEGALMHYKEEDIEKVRWIAVPSSPGGRTCNRCLELNGKEFLLKDAQGRIPLHPYCRCCYSAVV